MITPSIPKFYGFVSVPPLGMSEYGNQRRAGQSAELKYLRSIEECNLLV
jgi:hypothetical protein